MNNKIKHLNDNLAQYNNLAIAFSGGIDSTFLLCQAKAVLGKENVLAIVVNSELFRDSEFTKAAVLAESIGVKVVQTEMKELTDSEIAHNTPNGWYRSKKMLYTEIKKQAAKLGFTNVADGMIMDDLDDFRPGLKARDEEGILSPLQTAELFKSEIREAAKELKLPIWDKPASCSVASRFPYYTEITEEKVQQVMQAEKFINELGFPVVRVRHHGEVARIEVETDRIVELFNYREAIDKAFKELGFTFVAIDLNGYQMGKMNTTILEEKAM